MVSCAYSWVEDESHSGPLPPRVSGNTLMSTLRLKSTLHLPPVVLFLLLSSMWASPAQGQQSPPPASSPAQTAPAAEADARGDAKKGTPKNGDTKDTTKDSEPKDSDAKRAAGKEGGAKRSDGKGPPGGRPPGGGAPGGGITPVVVALVTEITRPPSFDASGLLMPVERVLVVADVTGRVKAIYKRLGDRVKAGELLAQLENPSTPLDLAVISARLKESEAALALSQQKLTRAEGLYKKNLTSADQYQDALAGVRIAEAKRDSDKALVAQLSSQVSRLSIRAPVDGEIISDTLDLGQWITPSMRLFEVYGYQHFEVRLGIPGRYLTLVPDEGPVTVSLQEPDRVLEGRILGVMRHVNPASGSFTLRIGVDNPKGLPLSGLMARVAVPLGASVSRLAVPRDAILRRGERTQVVLVRQDEAVIMEVRIVGAAGEDVLVEAAELKVGDSVVVRGNERLRPGMPVRVQSTPAAKGERGASGQNGA